MEKNRKVHFLITLLSIVFAYAINYAISFLLTPYITEKIGTEAYGYVSLANTFASYATVITVAINSIATRYITVEIHNNKMKSAREYFCSLFFADIVLDVFIFMISLILIVKLEKFLVISPTLQSDVKLLFLFTIVNFCITSASTVFTSSTIILDRLYIGSLFKAISYIGNGMFLVLGFSYLGAHVYVVGIGLICSSVILFTTNYAYTYKTLPELKISRNYIKLRSIKEVALKGIWYSLNSLGNILNSGLDLWISNLLLSALQMGQLAIVKTLSTIPVAIYQLIAQPLQPILLREYADRDKKSIVNTLGLGIKINGCLANILFAFFFAFGFNYFSLWTPSQDINVLVTLTLITLFGGVIEGTVTPLFYVYVLTLKNRIPCMVTLCSGLANVVCMYVLIKYCGGGLNVVVGTTTVLTWIINLLFNPIYSSKCLGIKLTTFFPIIGKSNISCFILTCIVKLISRIINPSSWGQLILVGAIIAIIGIIIQFICVMNKNERKKFWQIIKRRTSH